LQAAGRTEFGQLFRHQSRLHRKSYGLRQQILDTKFDFPLLLCGHIRPFSMPLKIVQLLFGIGVAAARRSAVTIVRTRRHHPWRVEGIPKPGDAHGIDNQIFGNAGIMTTVFGDGDIPAAGTTEAGAHPARTNKRNPKRSWIFKRKNPPRIWLRLHDDYSVSCLTASVGRKSAASSVIFGRIPAASVHIPNIVLPLPTQATLLRNVKNFDTSRQCPA